LTITSPYIEGDLTITSPCIEGDLTITSIYPSHNSDRWIIVLTESK
jgi:hypothetical protein